MQNNVILYHSKQINNTGMQLQLHEHRGELMKLEPKPETETKCNWAN